MADLCLNPGMSWLRSSRFREAIFLDLVFWKVCWHFLYRFHINTPPLIHNDLFAYAFTLTISFERI